jgi:hypothetical protein
MKTILDATVPHIVALIAAISGLMLAWAKLVKTRHEVSKSDPAAASPLAKRVSRVEAAPAITLAQADLTAAQQREVTRRMLRKPEFWWAIADLLMGFGAFTLLFVLTVSDAPVTEGRLAWCVLLGCAWIISSLRRSR